MARIPVNRNTIMTYENEGTVNLFSGETASAKLVSDSTPNANNHFKDECILKFSKQESLLNPIPVNANPSLVPITEHVS